MKLKALTAALSAAVITVSAGAFTAFADSGEVDINNTNFPDDNFRKYVSEKFDTDGNGGLSQGEIDAVSKIRLPFRRKFSNLKGIEYFTELTSLDCQDNQVTSLDVSKNTALTELKCHNNHLTSLDVSKNTALTYLNCGINKLKSLDVSNNTALKELYCFNNWLTSLDLSQNTALTEISCSDNRLRKLDVSNNTALIGLTCNSNQLTSLDVSKNTTLIGLECYSNHLTSLDVSNNTALTYLSCGNNQLKNLNVSNNKALTELSCGQNQLTSLDLSTTGRFDSDYDCSIRGNIYFIGKVTSYDLANLPEGFDISKASNWQGATLENGILTNFISDTITYTYDCGNDKSTTFILTTTEITDNNQDPVSAFVERLYTTLLGRPSDEKGKADWVEAIDNGTTAAEAASGFVLSEELKEKNLSNGEFVDRMYRTFLDREADETGKADWVSALDNGCSYGYILNSFAGSEEFNNLCDSYKITAGTYESTEPRDKNLDLTAFVSRMYTKALGRAYDTDGLNDWTGDYLDGKATANDIAYGFILSQEFINRGLSDEEYVDTLYRTFFDREPDEGGKAGWLDELNNGASRQDVLDGFLGADEFTNLKKSFGV